MKQYRFALPLCAALAISCGGSDEDNGPLTTGVFVGNVSQLRYTTRTESGLTDAAGTFSYRVGQKVTFSVGGTTLGTTTGAETVDVFDLAGVAAPTDGVIVLQQLDEDSRPMRPYFRAVDAWSFLMGLDADGNPNNGIDLGGRDAQLADVHVAFDWIPGDLDAELRIAARVPNYALRPNGLDAVFASLYATTGVTATGDAIAEISLSTPGSTGVVRYTYGDKAQASRIALEFGGALGATTELEHDESLRVTRSTFVVEPDGMGGLGGTRQTTNSYTATGVYTGTVTTDLKPGVGVTEASRITAGYDASGRLTVYRSVVVSVNSQTFDYDASANAVTALYEYSANAGADVSQRTRTRYGYDAAGNTTSTIYASDNTGAGYTFTTTTTAKFDDAGKMTSRSSTQTDATGATSDESSETYTYDGWRLVETAQASGPGDGTITRNYASSYVYEGDKLVHRTSTLQKLDGPRLKTGEVLQAFDANDHLKTINEKYFDDGGALTSEDVTTLTYDAGGNVATESQAELGSMPLFTYVYTYTPTPNGIVAGLQKQLSLFAP